MLLFCLLAFAHAYNIGFSVTDLSPTKKEIDSYGVWLGGYGVLGDRDGRIGIAEGVHDPIWARAVAIDDFDEEGDVVGLAREIMPGAKGRGEVRKQNHGSGVHSATSTPGQTLVILAVIDGIGMGSILLNHIRDNVTALEPKINRDNILISITHSHSAPDFQGLWGGVQRVQRSCCCCCRSYNC